MTWLDLSDAFPSVSHELMLAMMERIGLSGSVLHIVRDIYTQAYISVQTGRDSYTPIIPQQCGVKQGCPLSPILFNIVLEGLLRHLSGSQAGYTLAGHTINSLAYADDLSVAASNRSDMQSLLDRCMVFTEWVGFRFNARKCGSLCLVHQSPRIYTDDLYTPHLRREKHLNASNPDHLTEFLNSSASPGEGEVRVVLETSRVCEALLGPA